MIYQDTTNKQGILDLMRSLVKADEHTLPEETARVFLNMAVDSYYDIASKYRTDHQYDDENWGDFPIAEIDIVSNKKDYLLPDNSLRVKEVEVSGKTIDRVDKIEDLGTGFPRFFELFGRYIFLSPTPDFDEIKGLKVLYERAIKYFDGTPEQVIGIPSIHHKYLAIAGASIYAVKEGLQNAKNLFEVRNIEEEKIIDWFSHKDLKVGLQANISDTR